MFSVDLLAVWLGGHVIVQCWHMVRHVTGILRYVKHIAYSTTNLLCHRRGSTKNVSSNLLCFLDVIVSSFFS